MDWSKYYPANYSAITNEDLEMIREKKLAPVDKDAVKQDWKDRSDDDHVDIDKDGDEDSSDKFLHKKRKAITKAVEKEEIESEGLLDPEARAKKAAMLQKKQSDPAHQAAQARKKQAIANDPAAIEREKRMRQRESFMPVDEKRLKQKKSLNKKDYRDDNLKNKVKGIEEPDFSKQQDTVTNMEWAKKVFNNYHNIEEHCGWCDQGMEVEPVDELSTGLLKRAASAAHKDMEKQKDYHDLAAHDGGRTEREKFTKKAAEKREKQATKFSAAAGEKPPKPESQDSRDKRLRSVKRNMYNSYTPESKELPTSKGIAKQIKELAKAVRGKDRISIEGAASLVSKKDYDKLAPYLDKMSEDARQSILMVLMTDQKVANSVMKKMKTEQYDECIIPSHKFILEGMYKKYHELTWGEIGERLIKNTERRLVSLAYATKMGTIDAPSPEVQKLADECELEDLEKASKEYIEDDTDITEQELAELPNFMTTSGRAQNKLDKIKSKNDAMQKHQDTLSDIEAEKERSVELKSKQKPGIVKKVVGGIKKALGSKPTPPPVKTAGVRTVKSDAEKIADKAKKDQKAKQTTQIKKSKTVQTKAAQGRDSTAGAADSAQRKRQDAEAKRRLQQKNQQAKLADDPSLKKAAATSTRGKVLGGVASALLGGSYEPEGQLIEDFEDQTPEKLDARRRIFKEKIKKLAYEKAKEILGKRQPVEPIITKETNKNDKDDDGEGLDAVQPDAVQKKFKNRKDKDIDNDGDADDSDKFLHKKRKAVSKAMKKEDDEDESKVKENGKIDNKIKMEPEEEKMKESTGVAFVRKYKNKISETNEETSLQDQILELFRSSYASIDGEPVGAEFAVSDEPASASTIARTLRCSPTEVQKLLDDMVQAGQITRVGDAYSYASPRAAEPMGVRVNPTV